MSAQKKSSTISGRVKTCATIFAIGILFSGTVAPSLLISEADAMKSKGTSLTEINSNDVCGDRLCSAENNASSKASIILDSDEYESVTATTTNVSVSLLFVQTAHSGTLLQQDDKLVLTLNDVSPITVFFSDRPNRITGYESTQEFVHTWDKGDDSFQANQPNAAINILNGNNDGDVLIVELMNPMYDVESRTLQYEIIVLAEYSTGLLHYGEYVDASIPESFEEVVLFIDSFHDFVGNEGTKVAYDDTDVCVLNETASAPQCKIYTAPVRCIDDVDIPDCTWDYDLPQIEVKYRK